MSMHMPVPRRLHPAVVIVCVLVLWLSGAAAHASLSELPRLSRAHYASPSGDWVLTIDPSSRDGIGPTRYAMRHHGRLVWKTTLSYALWDAAVADDGQSGGAGYDTGYAGIGNNGNFIVALFDAQGNILGVDKTPRSDEMTGFHDFAYPRAKGLWLDAERNALVVRVAAYDKRRNGFPEHWWHYDLSSGERTRVIEPRLLKVETGHLEQARQVIPVQGTPLVLIHALHHEETESSQTAYGSHHAVLDANGQPIWSLLLQADIATGHDYPHDSLRQLEGIRSQQPRHFSVQSLQRNAWLGFQAIEDRDAASGWRIEAMQEVPIAPEQPTAELPAIALKHLGNIDLRGTMPSGAPSRIRHFAIDAQGRIGVIERQGGCDCEDTRYRFSLHSSDGAPLAIHSLDALELTGRDSLHVAALENGRWLLTTSSTTPDSRARAFTFDAKTFQPVAVDDFEVQHIKALASGADGSFVVLEARDARHTSTKMLHGHDNNGTRRWSIASDYRDEAALFSPADVTVLSDGTIAVLETIGERVKLYSDQGRHLETIELKNTWPHVPNYPTTIAADPNGGFWIEDFRGKAHLIHMSRQGKVTHTMEQVRYGDGRAVSSLGRVAVAPDGTVWADDYSAVFQLDASAQAQLTIGNAPDTGRIGTVKALSVMTDGRILVLDGRNHAVHLFDASGTKQRVLVSEVSDFPPDANDDWVALMPTGEVLAGWDGSGYVHFDVNGTRTGFRRFTERQGLFGEPLPHMQPDRLWWREFDSVSLIRLDGKSLVRHERDADGRWFSGLTHAAPAPDGSLAVANGLDGEPVVTLFDGQGALIGSWSATLTEGHHLSGLSFDGHIVVIVGRPRANDSASPVRLFGFDLHGQALFRAQVATRGVWDAFHVQRGDVSELWLRSGDLRLERHAWPQPGNLPDRKED